MWKCLYKLLLEEKETISREFMMQKKIEENKLYIFQGTQRNGKSDHPHL